MHALMDEGQGVVHFPEEAEAYCSPETAQRLHEQLQQAAAISRKLTKWDFEVCCLVVQAPGPTLRISKELAMVTAGSCVLPKVLFLHLPPCAWSTHCTAAC